MPLLLLWHPASTAPPVVIPDEVLGTRVRFLLYDDAGRPMGEIAYVTDCDMSWGENGPETATLTLPKYTDTGALNPELHYTRLVPGGRAALVEIDARARGIDEVFLGVAKTAPDSSEGSTVTITVEGPHAWLEHVTVPAQRALTSAPGRILRGIVTQLRGALHLVPGTFDEGIGIAVDLNGGSFLDVVNAFQDMTNDRLYMTAQPRKCQLVADWRSQLARQHTGTLGVVLADSGDGQNCTWSSENNLAPDLHELIVIGQSYDAGAGINAVKKTAPAGVLIGKHAALSAVLSTSLVAAVDGSGGQSLRPDLATKGSLEAAADAHVRRVVVATALVTLHVMSDDIADLRTKLKIGRLVTVELALDVLGYFRHAVGQVVAITHGLIPDDSLDITTELWSVVDGGA